MTYFTSFICVLLSKLPICIIFQLTFPNIDKQTIIMFIDYK